jgi:hypothetical protein
MTKIVKAHAWLRWANQISRLGTVRVHMEWSNKRISSTVDIVHSFVDGPFHLNADVFPWQEVAIRVGHNIFYQNCWHSVRLLQLELEWPSTSLAIGGTSGNGNGMSSGVAMVDMLLLGGSRSRRGAAKCRAATFAFALQSDSA